MHSTLTSLINITDWWLRNIDQGLVTGIVFIDLRKAFDIVNFEILLKRLKYYDVSDVELKWFTSYLHGRMQTVIIDGILSGSLPFTVGLQQGNIPGPLLFTFYVNELSKVAENCLTTMYADDTELEHAIKPQDIQTMKTTINNDLDKLQSYFKSNKLSLMYKNEHLFLLEHNRA